MLTNVRMMFARTKPNVGTLMDRISAFVKMDGKGTPVNEVTYLLFCSPHVTDCLDFFKVEHHIITKLLTSDQNDISFYLKDFNLTKIRILAHA